MVSSMLCPPALEANARGFRKHIRHFLNAGAQLLPPPINSNCARWTAEGGCPHYLLPNKKPSRWVFGRVSNSSQFYARTTFAAWKPLGPLSKSNSTVSPSFRVR
jgi:hypothetical protein